MSENEKKKKAEDKEKEHTTKIAEFYAAKEMKQITAQLEKLIVKPISNPQESLSSKNAPKLLTGTILDDILGKGGAVARQLIEMYGEFATGKTQICFTLTAEASQKGTVVYIDDEYTFSSDRVEGICKARGLNIEFLWKNLILFQPEDWMHQLAAIQQIPSPTDLEKDDRPPITLIIVDSLLALIDSSEDFEGRQNLPVRSRVIRTQILGKLRQLARLHNCPVLFTNQIQDVPDVKPFTPFYLKQRAKGGPTVSHVADIRLYLRKAAGDNRVARLMDSSELGTAERAYCINAKGIDDVPTEVKEKIANATKKEDEIELAKTGEDEPVSTEPTEET
jgi:DNA repair protein RadA